MKKTAPLFTIAIWFILGFGTQQALAQLSEKEFIDYLVLVKNSKGEVFQKIQGTTDIDQVKPILPNARFRIASITKLFTAVIAMQLVDEGKLSLENSMSEFLDYPDIKYADQITIRDLLQHTSGLQPENPVGYIKAFSPTEMIQRFATKKPNKPGEEHFYNNIDFLLLGQILEEVTGMSFKENLQTRILEPLEMEDSGLITTFELPEKIVPDYRVKSGKRKKGFKIHCENFWAAGAMYSTASDLLSFSEGIKAGKLLSKEAVKTIFTPDASFGYAALGCWVFNIPYVKGKPAVMERRGEIVGSRSVLMTNLDGPETVIVLSNTDQFDQNTFGVQDNLKEYLFKRMFK